MKTFVILLDGIKESVAGAREVIDKVQAIGNEYRLKYNMPYGIDILVDNEQSRLDPSSVERMVVGVGDGEWMLFHFSDDGAQMASLGNENATGTIMFNFGDWSEMSRKYLVKKEDALRALHVWLKSGRLGNEIRWTSSIY